MFFRKDASFDIAEEMENALVSEATEGGVDEQIVKFAKAIDHLNAVAEIFEELGLESEADTTITFLEVLAAKKGKGGKKSPKKGKKPAPSSKSKANSKSSAPAVKSKAKTDEAVKGLDSDKMVENLKHKGWVFNADDQVHAMGCECAMCSDDLPMQKEVNMADDFLGQLEMNLADGPSVPSDNAGWDKDEQESDLAKLMHDLESERAELGEMEFEDEK